jgi:hypothetical protein
MRWSSGQLSAISCQRSAGKCGLIAISCWLLAVGEDDMGESRRVLPPCIAYRKRPPRFSVLANIGDDVDILLARYDTIGYPVPSGFPTQPLVMSE